MVCCGNTTIYGVLVYLLPALYIEGRQLASEPRRFEESANLAVGRSQFVLSVKAVNPMT